jgi:hypothetical protein
VRSRKMDYGKRDGSHHSDRIRRINIVADNHAAARGVGAAGKVARYEKIASDVSHLLQKARDALAACDLLIVRFDALLRERPITTVGGAQLSEPAERVMRAVGACLSLWQLAPARLRDFNQGFDPDQPSLVVLEASGRFFPPRHERVHPLAQEDDILAILDHFGDETHATARGAKSSTIP